MLEKVASRIENRVRIKGAKSREIVHVKPARTLELSVGEWGTGKTIDKKEDDRKRNETRRNK